MTMPATEVSETALMPERPPLEYAEGGAVLRVMGTRVSIDTVYGAYADGATPEQIVMRYPSLALSDVYGAIAWCLTHREEMDAYLTRRRELEADTRRRIEERWPSVEIRERLLTLRQEAE